MFPMIGNPNNMDELLDKYVTFAEEYLIPQKELSLKRLNQVLSKHRKTLPPTDRAQFDALSHARRERRRSTAPSRQRGS